MTKLNEYRHPAWHLNEDQLEDVVHELLDMMEEDELTPWTYNILESLRSQIVEAEDGLNREP